MVIETFIRRITKAAEPLKTEVKRSSNYWAMEVYIHCPNGNMIVGHVDYENNKIDDDDEEEDDDEAEIYNVIVVPGNKTITAAKFLRDRLEMKLSEANDLLNEGGVIASFEDEDEAKAFQQEFASAGGVAICLKRE